jgi:hypothetical protein
VRYSRGTIVAYEAGVYSTPVAGFRKRCEGATTATGQLADVPLLQQQVAQVKQEVQEHQDRFSSVSRAALVQTRRAHRETDRANREAASAAMSDSLLRSTNQRVEDLEYRLVCCVCCERELRRCLQPCGHVLCEVCAERQQTCPSCRQVITSIEVCRP